MTDISGLQLSFPSDKRYLSLVSCFVQELCKLTTALSGPAGYNVQLAVDEAVVNIIDHAYGSDPGGRVRITARLAPDVLAIELCDWGEGFDPADVPDPDLTHPHERGYGVYLIRELMDQVTYEQDPSGSNCVTIIKNLTQE